MDSDDPSARRRKLRIGAAASAATTMTVKKLVGRRLLSEYNERRRDKVEKMLPSHGSERVHDAFHLLQTEPSVQGMVIALSSDTAVWDAVMNNEVVRELRESLYADEDNSSESPQENSDDNNDKAINIVKWIFQNTVAKVMEEIEKITKVIGDLFQPPSSENAKAEASNLFEKTS